MRFETSSWRRLLLPFALALPGVALGLVTQDAHAAWKYSVVDGTGSSNINSETQWPVWSATSAIVLPTGQTMPFYARFDPNAGRELWTGADWTFKAHSCDGTDVFSLVQVDNTHVDVFGAATLQDGSNTWIAYNDSNENLYAGVSAGPNAGAPLSSSLTIGTPSIALMGAGTYNGFVFYTVDGATQNEVHFQFYTASTNSWSGESDNVIDGSAGGDPAQQPSAVYWNNAIWVFYRDPVAGCLKAKSSTGDGHSQVDWQAHGCIDGGSGQHDVGSFPAAFVDPQANRLYVFYADNTAHALRSAFRDVTTGFTIEVVDSSVTISSPSDDQELSPMIAPVFNNGSPQVHYIDSVNHRVKRNTRGASGWGATALVTDGPGCVAPCNSTALLDGPIAVTMAPECNQGTGKQPHVFYLDGTKPATPALREAFFE